MSDFPPSDRSGAPDMAQSVLWPIASVMIATGLTAALFAGLFAFVDGRNVSGEPAAPAAEVEVAGAAPVAAFDPAALARGKALFNQACIACHGNDLRGGVGFNLVDAEWVHGATRAEILANIKAGFPDAGMVGFGATYDDSELSDIIDFIQSRREGWEQAEYAIWPLSGHYEDWASYDFGEVAGVEPLKSAAVRQGLPDFGGVELSSYVMSVSGTVRIPDGDPAAVWVSGGTPNLEIRIDGALVEPIHDLAGTLYPTTDGQHRLSITVATAGMPEWMPRDLVVLAVNPDTGQRHFPLSEAGRRFMDNTSYIVSAADGEKVVRRRVKNLPPASISVGLPSEVNYAFGTRTCSVVGLWTGVFLDIGPNIDGRGQAPAFPVGDWVFHEPAALIQGSNPAAECRYNKVIRHAGAAPVFHFTLDGTPYSLTGTATPEGIAFAYRNEAGGAAPVLRVPAMDGYTAEVAQDGPLATVTVKKVLAQ